MSKRAGVRRTICGCADRSAMSDARAALYVSGANPRSFTDGSGKGIHLTGSQVQLNVGWILDAPVRVEKDPAGGLYFLNTAAQSLCAENTASGLRLTEEERSLL